MHSLIYAVVEARFADCEESIENEVGDHMSEYEESQRDEQGNWIMPMSLVTSDHPEVRPFLDLEKFKKAPLTAFAEAVRGAANHSTWRMRATGVALFDAERYIFDRRKLPSGWKPGDYIEFDTREEARLESLDIDPEHMAINMSEAVLSHLCDMDITEVVFVDRDGKIAIARSLRYLAKWDWYVIGGRWSHQATMLMRFAGYNPTSELDRVRVCVVKDILNGDVHPRSMLGATLEHVQDHIVAIRKRIKDVDVEDIETLRDIYHRYLDEHFDPDLRSEEEYLENFGRDLQVSIYNCLQTVWVKYMKTGTVKELMEYVRFRLAAPLGLVTAYDYYDYDSYACGDDHDDIKAAVARKRRFVEDLNHLDDNDLLMVVDIHI